MGLKGRCTRCWGSLLARFEDHAGWTGIKCRVCGIKFEGEKARNEIERMQAQTSLNFMDVRRGRAPEYSDTTFVQKFFPTAEPYPEEELAARVRRSQVNRKGRTKLTRHDFPPGSPGLLFIQAHILMAGVAGLSYPDEMSIAEVPDLRPNDDGSLTMHLSTKGFGDDPQYSENRLKNRMGTTMIEAMTAAFACELAIKAICLTCKDEAPKSHDLIALYDDLPALSKQRIETDYPEIVGTLRTGRHTFGQWRYFEVNVGEAGMRAMIDVPHAHAFGKAARVILDEAVMVGLGATVELETKDDIVFAGDTENHSVKFRVNIKARENPPPTRGPAPG